MTRLLVPSSALSDLYSDILKAEAAFCFTLVELAAVDVRINDWESAHWLLRTAQQQYNTLVEMLGTFPHRTFVEVREDVEHILPLLKRLEDQIGNHLAVQ